MVGQLNINVLNMCKVPKNHYFVNYVDIYIVFENNISDGRDNHTIKLA